MIVDWGRAVCGDVASAERREWLCTNGIGGFASGTVAGTLTRRYHGLLVAALKPPLGRTLVCPKVDETVEYEGLALPLFANRWAGNAIDPNGYRAIERFTLEGTTPVWTYAVADALVERRVWMEHGANTTYVRYRVLRARGRLAITLKTFVNHRDYHGTTRGESWRMDVTPVEHGLRVLAFDGARPLLLLAEGAKAEVAHTWYRDFELTAERERGLTAIEDHLHAGTFSTALAPSETLTLVISTEPSPALDGELAWNRRAQHEAGLITGWKAAQPGARKAPDWIERLVLASDQFVARRPTSSDPEGMTVIAGYHWFGDWGRDTMISLPGLALATGRPEIARRILTTFARFVDRGMLPNRFPDAGEAPEYNTVDATLWYFEAIRAYHALTHDDGLVKELFPVLQEILRFHREGTRYGIKEDATDGLLRSGEPGIQLTWMDARVGDWVVTPRSGKAVEINALWYNALLSMVGFAKRLGFPSKEWSELAARVKTGFGRFWNEPAGCCYDVIDSPDGNDDAVRPNQIYAVSLPESPLAPERQRQVVDACARHLLTSHGLRSLSPDHPSYQGHYGGDQSRRDGAYHQGTVWAFLLGPFALAHFRVYRDAEVACSFLLPMAHHLGDYGLGSIAEIFDGDEPFEPRGCVAQAWSVAEILRAWQQLAAA